MPAHTKVKLADIRALTFYAGDKTQARRTSPIDQLTCIGKPCRTYQPDVVRCTNTGGTGVDIDWKCEADLPSTLRLGRVEVSCEGWARAGDPNVLKGSCGLEYHLQEIPRAYRDQVNRPTGSTSTVEYFNTFLDWGFYALFAAVFLFIAYHIIRSCLTRPLAPANGARPGGGGGGGGGWFNTGGGPHPNPDAPPPYTPKESPGQTPGWRPGFWTGLGAGGLLGRYFRPSPYVQPSVWDWDRPTRAYQAPPPQGSERASPRGWFSGGGGGSPSPPGGRYRDTDRGEGSSSGTMRSSTGYGGSRVR